MPPRQFKVSMLLIFAVLALSTVLTSSSAIAQSLYEISPQSITGESAPLSEYRGKVLMIVNTASQCGFTSQLGDLETLYQEFHDRGFEILGFPSNDFGNQEPLDNPGVKNFCTSKYGVTF